jgi:glyoxylase-like metal-dependent hydrolase (beta-lactamase superfamily II)
VQKFSAIAISEAMAPAYNYAPTPVVECAPMKCLACFAILTLVVLAGSVTPKAAPPDYSIEAIRYASAEDEVAGLVMGAPKGEKINIAMVIWLIRGNGHNILFDSGYHRDTFLKYFPSTEYISPDEAVKLAGVQPGEITDIVISHSHWDHLGGIDLFPKANVWIQKEEFRYYTGDAWQPGGNHGGIDPEDVRELVRVNTQGRLKLVDGDDVEIFPGIRAYTGGHHTYASQYIRVEGNIPFVLASDNCYLYRNLAEHKASATFSDNFHAANIKNQERMIELAGGNPDRVIPGHDAAQFQKYSTQGRIAKIK